MSKGVYLTHLRKKKSAFKTAKKTKSIAIPTSQNNSKTIKKSITSSVTYNRRKNIKNMMIKSLYNDKDVFTSIPTLIIPMEVDNDCES